MDDTKIITTTKQEEEQEEDELEQSSNEDDTPSPPALPPSPPLAPSPSVTASPSPSPASLSPQIVPGPPFPLAPASTLPSPNIKRNRPHRRLFAPNLGPGQHIFQLDLKPESPSSNGSSSACGTDGGVGSPESDDRRAPATYTSITSFNPPSPLTACKCANKSKKPMRHWRTACPYNPNPLTVDCDVCGRTFTRKQNMERHKKDFHSGPGTKERRKQAQIPNVTSSDVTVVAVGGGSVVGKDVPARLHSPSTPTEKG